MGRILCVCVYVCENNIIKDCVQRRQPFISCLSTACPACAPATLQMEDLIQDYMDETNSQRGSPSIPIPYQQQDVNVLLQTAAQLSSTLKSLSTAPLPQSSIRLLVLSLRQVNRLLQGKLVEQRQSLAELKGGIDELNAKLIAAQFDKQHLYAQAQKCLAVK